MPTCGLCWHKNRIVEPMSIIVAYDSIIGTI